MDNPYAPPRTPISDGSPEKYGFYEYLLGLNYFYLVLVVISFIGFFGWRGNLGTVQNYIFSSTFIWDMVGLALYLYPMYRVVRFKHSDDLTLMSKTVRWNFSMLVVFWVYSLVIAGTDRFSIRFMLLDIALTLPYAVNVMGMKKQMKRRVSVSG